MKTSKDNEGLWSQIQNIPSTVVAKRIVLKDFKNGFPQIEKIVIETYEWVQGEGILYNTDTSNREPIKVEEYTPEEYAKLPIPEYKYQKPKMYMGERQYNEFVKAIKNQNTTYYDAVGYYK